MRVEVLNVEPQKATCAGKTIGKSLGDAAVIASFNLDPAYSRMADEELVSSAWPLTRAGRGPDWNHLPSR